MKHIRDVEKLLKDGDSAGAYVVLDNLLALAPRNPDALRLKAHVLDGWGRFDESLGIFKTLSQFTNLSDENLNELETCAAEEKEAFVYSELSAEGRWFFSFPRSQIWISLYGFVGCGLFLLISPTWLAKGVEGFHQLLMGFFFFVLVPWLALITVHCIGIKKILVGLHGLRICKRFSQTNHEWNKLKVAVIEYDNDLNKGHLKLSLYEHARGEALVSFDISRAGSVVKARRHFVRNVTSYVDTVCYVNRSAGAVVPAPAVASEELPQLKNDSVA